VDGARRARDVDASRNVELARALQPSSVDQAVGLDPADVDYDLGARSCFLKSERHPALDRLERIEQLLDDPGFLGYLPAVEAFLHLHPPGSFDASERAVFQRIQKHDGVRERFQKLIYDLATPVVRLEMLGVARTFGWMSDDEALGLEREIVLAALRPPVYGQGRDLVCGIDPDLRPRLQVRADELRPEIYTDEFGIQALGCLKPADDRIHLMLSRSLFDRREWIARYAAIALKEIRPARVDVQLALAQQLGRAESGPRKSAGEALREIKSADPLVLETIRKADPSFQIDWP